MTLAVTVSPCKIVVVANLYVFQCLPICKKKELGLTNMSINLTISLKRASKVYHEGVSDLANANILLLRN